jgi:hypothetical protein
MIAIGKNRWPRIVTLAWLLAGTVEAAPVTMQFVAQVDYATNVPGVAVGDIVHGEYMFDSAIPNTSPNPTVGRYVVNSGTFSLSVESLSFGVSPYLIAVGNDTSQPAGTQDFYDVEGFTAIAGVDHFYQLFLSTFDLSQGAITSTALPLVPPDVAKFPEFHRFGYCYGLTDASLCTEHGIGGPVTSITLVPEPATLALVGLGLAGFGFSRRKQ